MTKEIQIVPEISEVRRFSAPGPEPLGVAFDGTMLWIGSREAHRIYAVDPSTWTVHAEEPAPGAPFGIAVDGDGLRVVVGFGNDDDDRYIYRFVRGSGFQGDPIECPDRSGVHLAVDGGALFLSQAHNRKILSLGADGAIVREIRLDRVPVGMTIVDTTFYLITGEKNFKSLQLTRLGAREETPQLSMLASIPFVARGLAFDGSLFWTGDRSTNEIVSFGMPELSEFDGEPTSSR